MCFVTNVVWLILWKYDARFSSIDLIQRLWSRYWELYTKLEAEAYDHVIRLKNKAVSPYGNKETENIGMNVNISFILMGLFIGRYRPTWSYLLIKATIKWTSIVIQ